MNYWETLLAVILPALPALEPSRSFFAVLALRTRQQVKHRPWCSLPDLPAVAIEPNLPLSILVDATTPEVTAIPVLFFIPSLYLSNC